MGGTVIHRKGNAMFKILSKEMPGESQVEPLFSVADTRQSDTFRERLSKLCAGDTIHTMDITPAMAEVMLERNTRFQVDGLNPDGEIVANRTINPTAVRRYAVEMKNGLWRTTHQGIAFDSDGFLCDGQHRLNAIIEAGVTVRMVVFFGRSPGDFAVLDTGSKRTAGHVLSMAGVPDANNIAAAVKFLMLYDMGRRSDPDGITINSEDVKEAYFQRYSDIQSGAPLAERVAKNSRIMGKSKVLALWYIFSRKSRRDADAFFEKIADNYGYDSKSDPALKLYRCLSGDRLHWMTAAAFTVMAWNVWRAGKTRISFKWRKDNPNESFPRAV